MNFKFTLLFCIVFNEILVVDINRADHAYEKL
jgi:hypothetical protein